MSLTKVVKEGLGKVLMAPSLLLWTFVMLLLMAVPASLAMRETISDSIGPSLVQENLREGFDRGWWGEFSNADSGLASTFGPAVTGGLPVLTNLETFLDGRLSRLHPTVLATGAFFLLFWIFLQGGIIDRYARAGEPHSRERLFSRSSRHFFRMLRLALLSVFGYWVILVYIGGGLQSWVGRLFRDSTSEGPVVLVTGLIYVLVFVLWWIFSLGIDYAKVALVVERRRSAFFSTLRGFGFVLSHPLQCFGVSLLTLLVAGVFGGFYFLLAPGPGQATWQAVLIAFLVGQLYLLARIATLGSSSSASRRPCSAQSATFLQNPILLSPHPGISIAKRPPFPYPSLRIRLPVKPRRSAESQKRDPTSLQSKA